MSKNPIKNTILHKTKNAIALLLMLTFAFAIVALPEANTHMPAWQIPTHAKIAVSANPVGVRRHSQLANTAPN